MTETCISFLNKKEKSIEDQMKETKLKQGLVFSFSRDNDIFACVVVQTGPGRFQVIGLNTWNRYTENVLTPSNSVYDVVYDEDYIYSDFIIYSKLSIDLIK